ncbi:MAG: M23 family metallopeptidase [Candidatus Shapirobacteria bacterium]|nr:M23 family metallopeptidase [Candidatus Shapirobacteria bacterium]MDD4383190.1 M23 family metallopeptidase [Candidatus Shapirobacteria bacterium]
MAMPIGTVFTLWSYRKELKIVTGAFLLILLLPVVAVIILTQTGINIVSDKLVSLDSSTNTVEIHDPTSGVVITTISSPMIWPVKGVITLEFGKSDLPYEIMHTGIDIANPQGKIGDDISPFMDGTVIYAGETAIGYGKHIIIDHGNNVTSLYGHLDKVLVYKGEKVTINDVIGKMGSTGWSTGPHVHFQINVFGIPVNPRTFLGQITIY